MSEPEKPNNVALFNGITSLPIAPDLILESAKGKLETVVLVGWTEDGDFYLASSDPDAAENVLLLERAKYRLMQSMDDLEAGDA